MKFLYASLLTTLTLTSSAETITNTMPCDETTIVTKMLVENFKEIPIIMGKTNDEANSVMSFWINPKTGTWTIVATKNQLSCVIGVGRNLQILDLGKTI